MSYSAVILAEPALQSYWRFNEASGNALDSKGAISGTLSAGGATLPVQKSAGLLWQDSDAAYFFSSAAFVDFGTVYLFAGTAAFSVECWFLLDVLLVGTNQDLLNNSRGANGGWRLTVNAPGAPASGVEFTRIDSGAGFDVASTDTLPLSTGVTYHAVGTYDGANMNLYLNGALVSGPIASSRLLTGGSNPLVVSSGGNPLTGTIDEVAIYNAALTRQKVQNHYAAGAAGGVLIDPMSVAGQLRN